jgi:filamentous hemagglutinin family protein
MRRNGQRRTTLLRPAVAIAFAGAATLVVADRAMANPAGGTVVAGEAQITVPDPSTLHVNQSTNKAIINWQSFNIGEGETTRFFQPGASSVTLNRVVGSQDPSMIMGSLRANGTVMVINPDGILFGPNSRIDVGGLVASTSDIDNDDFMAGTYSFSIPGKPAASIVNQGNISIADHGIGAFVAPAVRNSGVINARLGTLGLAAANAFTLDMYGDDLISLELDDALEGEVIDVSTGETLADRVANEGRINADGGVVALSAATARKVVNSVVNNTGVIEARSVGTSGGRIVLGAQTAGTKVNDSAPQTVSVSGTLDASGRGEGERGGFVAVSGEHIELHDALVNADGEAGGGRVLVGGDYMGGSGDPATIARYGIELEDEPVPTALTVWIAGDATIGADATHKGDGGKVVVWADGATHTAGNITARGGEHGGDGGFIETSGAYLDVRKAADASAPSGQAGTWLLDPLDIRITDAQSENTRVFVQSSISSAETFAGEQCIISCVVYMPTKGPSNIAYSIIEESLNEGNNVSISTVGTAGSQSGNIYIDADLKSAGMGIGSLSFLSSNNIYIADGINFISSLSPFDILLFAGIKMPKVLLGMVRLWRQTLAMLT